MTQQTSGVLDDLLRLHVPEDGPGCAIGLVAGGELEAAATRGLANLEHRVPIEPDTVFHVASVSKQFAAYSCVLLAERGDLDLDVPVARILDRFPFDSITTRHLIHHVSGLRDQWALLLLSGRSLEDVITTAEILELVARQQELNFPPGSSHAYSNTGYTLLGAIVEAVSGASIRDFAAREIFAPLGMNATRFVDDHHEVVAGRADSYYSSSGIHRRLALSYSTAGATSLNTTVPDLARWAVHAMSPPARRQLEQRVTLTDGSPLDYATGVMLGTYRGRALIEHSGGDAGFRAHVAMLPDEGLAAIALSNSAHCPVYDLAYRALDLALDEIGAPAAAGTSWRPSQERLAELAGLYIDPFSGETHTLVAHDGGVAVGSMKLDPVRAGALGLNGGRTVELQLEPEVSLRTVGMSARPLLRAERSEPAPSRLADLAGRYWSEELSIGWTIDRHDDHLVVAQPRWGTVQMVPTIENGFSVSAPHTPAPVQVDLHFEEGGREMSVSMGRIVRLRFRRVKSV